MTSPTKTKTPRLPIPQRPTLGPLRRATRVLAAGPLLILGLWWALRLLIGPSLPGQFLPPVPRLYVVLAALWALALFIITTIIIRSAVAAHGRLVQKIELANTLAKAGRYDPTRARVTVRRDGATIYGVTIAGVHVSPAAEATLGRALAGYLGADPAAVTVARDSRGRIHLRAGDLVHQDLGTDLTDMAEGAPADDDKPLADPLANETDTARATRVLRGALSGKDFEVTALTSHRDGRPAKFAIHYPPERTHGLGEALADVTATLTRALPPRNGVWRHEWRPEQDVVVLTDETDPLAGNVPLQPVAGDVDLVEGVPVGAKEDGDPWRLPLMGGAQLFIAGATGAGKSSVLWSLLRGLEARVANGSVKVWALDPKLVELHTLDGYVHRFAAEPEHVNEALTEAISAMNKRKRAMAAKGMKKLTTPTAEFPAHIIFVDEVASMTEHPVKAIREDFVNLTSLLIREGRALGFTLVVAGQDVRKSALPHRALFTLAVCLRVNEAADVAMVLGQGARAQGAFADRIPRGLPGVAYVANEATGDILRVRASYVTDAEQEAIRDRLGEAHAAAGATTPEHIEAPAITKAPAVKAVQPALEEAPAPEPPTPTDAPETGQWVRVDHLDPIIDRDGHAFVLFEGDPDTVRVTAVKPRRDDDVWEVTYNYPGGPDTGTDVERDTEVQIMPAATWR